MKRIKDCRIIKIGEERFFSNWKLFWNWYYTQAYEDCERIDFYNEFSRLRESYFQLYQEGFFRIQGDNRQYNYLISTGFCNGKWQIQVVAIEKWNFTDDEYFVNPQNSFPLPMFRIPEITPFAKEHSKRENEDRIMYYNAVNEIQLNAIEFQKGQMEFFLKRKKAKFIKLIYERIFREKVLTPLGTTIQWR